MGALFQPTDLLIALGFLTIGLMPVWVAGYRRASHYLFIALVTVVGCGDFSAHGATVWAIALIWSCYDKPKDKPKDRTKDKHLPTGQV